jgi:ATP-dependent helicase HepA
MKTTTPMPGQRWVSETEPELGLGVIERVEGRRVAVLFPATRERRAYALASAPLRRVTYREGDRIVVRRTGEAVVQRVGEESDGRLVYHTDHGPVPEGELEDSVAFGGPIERLLAGALDDPALFDLRVEALRRRGEIRRSPARGFAGARIDLIAHQLFIASEVSARLTPRVLLADEVGLGKTIEAGLILHRLHLTGRADRVLVLVPEPLIHQWFVELLRRFNLLFSIFDEERCAAIEAGDRGGNPFLDSQLVLCSVTLLAGDAQRRDQALGAGWDLLVVDEAHHLEWSPMEESESYALVAALAAVTPGLLLLTATPQQLGPEGHFARLRLLDPDRFGDLGTFLEESRHYEEVARAVDHLLKQGAFGDDERRLFAAKSPRVVRLADELAAGSPCRDELVAALVDEFGPGRVMFRNTRAALRGFPERRAHLVPLEPGETGDATLAKLRWLAGFLRESGAEKILLICRTRELAEEIAERLLGEIQVNIALFHEDLSLMQRDRNAAFFADEDGARILVCSEIGSEGRNFQFAHHLVLFDLPENPELLEQRIGRLDRIGQSSTIHVHVPYLSGSSGEAWARWYHEGLDAFTHSLHGAAEITRELGGEWRERLLGPVDSGFDEFLKRSRNVRRQVTSRLERGYDRLLGLGSCDLVKAERIIAPIRALDESAAFEAFVIRLAETQGMHVEEMSRRTWFLRPDNLVSDVVPGLPPEGLTFTFDRPRALSREHEGFLTCDHPLVRGLLDLLLGSRTGNSAFAIWDGTGEDGLVLEAHFVIECLAPAAWHVDRFLPPTPLRIAVDHATKNLTDDVRLKRASVAKGDPTALLGKPMVRKKLLPAMAAEAERLAGEASARLVPEAMEAMRRQLTEEVERLEDLGMVNRHVTPGEIEALKRRREDLATAIAAARVRLDAVRLIFRRR